MATVSSAVPLYNWPVLVHSVQVSAIVPDEDLDIAHGGPAGAKVGWMQWELIERPTTKDVVCVEYDSDNNSLVNDTARVAIGTTAAGDLTGAVVRLLFFFVEQASGGIGS